MVLVFGDNLHRKRTSVATYGIAAACVAVTVAEISLPEATIAIDRLFAFVPIEFSLHPAVSLYTLVTAEFLHSGILHLVGNLVFLIAFGRWIRTHWPQTISRGICQCTSCLLPWVLAPKSCVANSDHRSIRCALVLDGSIHGHFPASQTANHSVLARSLRAGPRYFPQHGLHSRYWIECSSAKQPGA